MKSTVIFAFALFLVACGGNKDGEEVETTSHGSLTLYCDDQIAPLIRAEVAAYDSIFPDVHLTIATVNAREAVTRLLNGATKLIVIGRRLEDDERALAAKYGFPYGEYEIAKDALAVIVNRRNPLDTLGVPGLARIVNGAVRNWAHLTAGFPEPLHTVIPNTPSSAYRHLMELVRGADVKTADVVCDSAPQVVQRVRADPGAIGVVDWNTVWNDTTVKVLRMAGVDSTGAQGAYTLLHPAYIYLKRYPFVYSIYGYTSEGRPALAKGFLAFVCNADGQRLALLQQLVPATQIIRLREPD